MPIPCMSQPALVVWRCQRSVEALRTRVALRYIVAVKSYPPREASGRGGYDRYSAASIGSRPAASRRACRPDVNVDRWVSSLTPIVVKDAIGLADLRGSGWPWTRTVSCKFLGAHPVARRCPTEGLARPSRTSHLSGFLSHDSARRHSGCSWSSSSTAARRWRRRPDRAAPRRADATRLKPPRHVAPATSRRRIEIDDDVAAHAEMIADAKELLRLMGLPVVQAPSEGEAQAAHMARRGGVWAAASKDYDALLAERPPGWLSVNLGTGSSCRASTFRPIMPELSTSSACSTRWALPRPPLIDLGLLVGPTFMQESKGSARRHSGLWRRHGAIEQMPSAIRDAFGADLDRLRQIYLEPDVRMTTPWNRAAAMSRSDPLPVRWACLRTRSRDARSNARSDPEALLKSRPCPTYRSAAAGALNRTSSRFPVVGARAGADIRARSSAPDFHLRLASLSQAAATRDPTRARFAAFRAIPDERLLGACPPVTKTLATELRGVGGA